MSAKCLAAPHEVGALASCLELLASHDLNLTKIESRPRPRVPWEYLFYLDFEGDARDDHVADVLRALAAKALFLKVLGSYPMLTLSREPATESAPPRFVPACLAPEETGGGRGTLRDQRRRRSAI